MVTCRRPTTIVFLATLVSLTLIPSRPRTAAAQAGGAGFLLEEVIAFVSTRHAPEATDPLQAAELYVMNPDGTDARRLTYNESADLFPALSPDGRKVVFDSNRLRVTGEPINTSDLFVMDWDGENLAYLGRGGSATWSPAGSVIAFHASASGVGLPKTGDLGAGTRDSDIFVLNIDEAVTSPGIRTNLTNDPLKIDEDPDWSPDGQRIVFTSHDMNDPVLRNPLSSELWVMDADGSNPTRLTYNAEEERGPAWSPDGTRIVYMCRRGPIPPNGRFPTFEICVINADGTGELQLTINSVPDLTPNWSLDSQRIVFHRDLSGLNDLFQINADGTGETRLTAAGGHSLLANPGLMVVRPASQELSAGTSLSAIIGLRPKRGYFSPSTIYNVENTRR